MVTQIGEGHTVKTGMGEDWTSNHLSSVHTLSHNASDFHHTHIVMHRHKMVKIEDSAYKLNPGYGFALSCMYTRDHLRQPRHTGDIFE